MWIKRLQLLAKDGSYLVATRMVNTVTSLFIVYILANFIPPETYGTYKYILSVMALLAITALPGIGTAIIHSVSRGYEGTVAFALKKQQQYSLIGSFAGLLIGAYYFIQDNNALALAFFGSSLLLPLMSGYSIYQSYLNGKKKLRLLAHYSITFYVLLAACFSAVLFVTDDVVILVISYFTITALLHVVLYLNAIRTVPPNDNLDPDFFYYSKHLSFIKAVSTGSGSLQQIALWHFLGPLALPVYALAVAPIEQIRPVLQTAENLLLPKFSADNWQQKGFTWFLLKTAPFTIIISLFSLVYIAIAPSLFAVLFPLYPDAVLYTQIFAISLPITALQIVLTTILKAKRQVAHLHTMNNFSIALNFLVILIIYYFGILGFVISILLVKALELLILTFLIFQPKN